MKNKHQILLYVFALLFGIANIWLICFLVAETYGTKGRNPSVALSVPGKTAAAARGITLAASP